MIMSKAAKIIFGVASTVLFTWLAFASIEIPQVLNALSSVRWSLLAVAVGFFCCGYSFRILRWAQMLRPYNHDLKWRTCAVPFLASIALNNLVPLRAGDILRATAFSKWLGVPTARVLTTLVLERVLDVFALVVTASIALAYFRMSTPINGALQNYNVATFLAIAAAIGVVLIYPKFIETPLMWGIRQVSKLRPELGPKLEQFVGQGMETLSALTASAQIFPLISFSLIAWLCEACVFYCVALALPDVAVPSASLLAMPVGTLSTMLPSAPGYVGTFHYFVSQAVAAFGNSEVASATFSIVVHLTLYLPATLLGGACFLYWVLVRWSGSQQAVKKG